MTNAYCGLATLKARVNITGTGDDTALRLLLEAASRAVDKYCHRWFYAISATRYYAGAGNEFFLNADDLLSITTLKTDEDGDGTFENTLTENTDFFLYPLNEYPKTRAEINPEGSYSMFGAGTPRGVQIVGLFGYGTGDTATPYTTSTTTTNEELDASETDVDVISATPFEVGHTILVESEQMYITGVATGVLTVRRGVNGTTAATHATSKTVYIYEYPSPIKEATLMTAARLWKRKDSAYARVIASPEMGQIEVYRGMDEDIKLLLSQYIKRRWF